MISQTYRKQTMLNQLFLVVALVQLVAGLNNTDDKGTFDIFKIFEMRLRRILNIPFLMQKCALIIKMTFLFS